MQSALTTPVDNFDKLKASIEALTRKDVLVGVPEDNNDRKDKSKFGNAGIGYINENGSPAQNIPARPHLTVGILNAKERIVAFFAKAGQDALSGDVDAAERGLNEAGLAAVDSVKMVITDGLMPALADSTVQARARRGRKGAKQEMVNRRAGIAPSSALAKPLLDTSEYRDSITYVIRGA